MYILSRLTQRRFAEVFHSSKYPLLTSIQVIYWHLIQLAKMLKFLWRQFFLTSFPNKEVITIITPWVRPVPFAFGSRRSHSCISARFAFQPSARCLDRNPKNLYFPFSPENVQFLCENVINKYTKVEVFLVFS